MALRLGVTCGGDDGLPPPAGLRSACRYHTNINRSRGWFNTRFLWKRQIGSSWWCVCVSEMTSPATDFPQSPSSSSAVTAIKTDPHWAVMASSCGITVPTGPSQCCDPKKCSNLPGFDGFIHKSILPQCPPKQGSSAQIHGEDDPVQFVLLEDLSPHDGCLLFTGECNPNLPQPTVTFLSCVHLWEWGNTQRSIREGRVCNTSVAAASDSPQIRS